jgi:hypothetical protein
MEWINIIESTTNPSKSASSNIILIKRNDGEFIIGFKKNFQHSVIGSYHFYCDKFDNKIVGNDCAYHLDIPDIPNRPKRLNEKTSDKEDAKV